ncbi:hypothetical protein LZC95_07705 [Pendulispora brunnea]|uniref:Uncharacterized protein n=1 Tax=Pendulispora brunnea TaxID=2905690 RepID=A0ABZ2KDQ2_9BACT
MRVRGIRRSEPFSANAQPRAMQSTPEGDVAGGRVRGHFVFVHQSVPPRAGLTPCCASSCGAVIA